MTRHQYKDVASAIGYAKAAGWDVDERHAGHIWGYLLCGKGCKVRVHSTPRNQGDHAKDLRWGVDRCPHRDEAEEVEL